MVVDVAVAILAASAETISPPCIVVPTTNDASPATKSFSALPVGTSMRLPIGQPSWSRIPKERLFQYFAFAKGEKSNIGFSESLLPFLNSEHDFVLTLLMDLMPRVHEIYHGFVIEVLGDIGHKAISSVPLLQMFLSDEDNLNAIDASLAIGRITRDWTSAFNVGVPLFRSDNSLGRLVARDIKPATAPSEKFNRVDHFVGLQGVGVPVVVPAVRPLRNW